MVWSFEKINNKLLIHTFVNCDLCVVQWFHVSTAAHTGHRVKMFELWALLAEICRDHPRTSKASEAGRRASLTVSALVEKRLQFRSNLSLELIMCQKNQFKKRDSAQCHFWPYLEVFITLDLRPKKCVKNNQNRDFAVVFWTFQNF